MYLDFSASINRLGEDKIRERYGNLFDMYERITGENAYKQPMRIYPAIHYTMGGLWVDYELMSNVSGLFVIGEANFSDHGANRLGASALMQGLADGYFVLPQTIGGYFVGSKGGAPSADHPEFKKALEDIQARTNRLLSIKGKRTVTDFHRELGKVMWDNVGMGRTDASLKQALKRIPKSAASSGKTSMCWAAAVNSIRRWNTRAASPTFWNLPNYWLTTRCNAKNPAAATSAKNTRPKTAKRCGRMTSLPTSRPGNSKAWINFPSCTKNRWFTKKCI